MILKFEIDYFPLAISTTFIFNRFTIFLNTIARRVAVVEDTTNNSGGTTHARFYRYGSCLAIKSTGSALHAVVDVGNYCPLLFDLEYSMWADRSTHSTTVAKFRVQL
jgi:hypothetical protein